MNAWSILDRLGSAFLGRRFIAGSGVEDVLRRGVSLKARGFCVTYNLLGEHVSYAPTVEKAMETTLELLAKMSTKNSGNISCKPTLYGLGISQDAFRQNIQTLLPAVMRAGVEIEIDAENAEYIPATFEIFSEVASTPPYHNSVRQAVQAHRADIFELLHKYGMLDKRLRIVKGSGVYADDGPALLSEDMVALQYLALVRENMHTGSVPYAATVRDRLLAKEVMGVAGGNIFSVEFETLYGPLGKKLGQDLLKRGYAVRVYLPFVVDWCKSAWKPYGLRRAAMMRKLFLQEIMSRARKEV